MKNVLVVFGGVSQEHDISVLTGVLTTNSVDPEKFTPLPVYIDKTGVWYTGNRLKDVSFYKNADTKKLKKVTLVAGDDRLFAVFGKKLKVIGRIYCAINCLHGRNGEDGSFSGLIDLCGIPLASPDVFSSAASLDKVKTKIMLKGIGVKAADYVSVSRTDYYGERDKFFRSVKEKLGFPAIVKPSSSGSSIGITVVNEDSDFFAAMDRAFLYDNRTIVERFLTGAEEVNCAAYMKNDGIVLSGCEKPLKRGAFLTFADKYASSKYGEDKEFPAKLEKSVEKKIRETTKKVYSAFGFKGAVRIDYLIKDGAVYLNEINGVPGSLAYYLFSDTLKGFSEMLGDMIEQGVKDRLRYDGAKFDYESDVLSFKGIALKK